MPQNTDGVVLLYRAKAQPGKENQLREALVSLVTGSRHDPGNIVYELHEVADDPATFILYEQWISQEMLDAHIATPPLQEFQARASELMEGDFEAGIQLLKKLRPEPKS